VCVGIRSSFSPSDALKLLLSTGDCDRLFVTRGNPEISLLLGIVASSHMKLGWIQSSDLNFLIFIFFQEGPLNCY